MLVLSRKKNEAIKIGPEIEIIVLEIHGDRVKLGFSAPIEVPIHRREVHERINPPPGNMRSARKRRHVPRRQPNHSICRRGQNVSPCSRQ